MYILQTMGCVELQSPTYFWYKLMKTYLLRYFVSLHFNGLRVLENANELYNIYFLHKSTGH